MIENTPDQDSYIERVANAASIRGMMDDPRWPMISGLIRGLKMSADSKAKSAMRNPSFDGIAKATHFGGQVAFAETLLRTFDRLYTESGRILEEARSILPRAPLPKGTPREDAAPEGIPAKEE